MKNNQVFFSLTALCIATTMTCNGMINKKISTKEEFKLTIENKTKDIASVKAFYKEKGASDLGAVKVGSSRAFTVDKKNLVKVEIVAGSTRETVTDFSDKTITLIKKTSGPSTAAGFSGPTLVGKK